MPTVAAKKPTDWSSTLRQLRRKHNLTRAEAAARIGVSERTLISWENAQYRPSAMALRLLYEAFPELKPAD